MDRAAGPGSRRGPVPLTRDKQLRNIYALGSVARELGVTIFKNISAGTITERQEKTSTELAGTWNVLVFDDPVNLMGYVTKVFQKVFGYSLEQAEDLMITVHTAGKALVWSGAREPAELYVQQLHSYQLQASLEKAQQG